MTDLPHIIIQDLPHSVKGFCYHDDNGENYIVVNSRTTKEQQRRTAEHELEHIRSGEMYDPGYKEYD